MGCDDCFAGVDRIARTVERRWMVTEVVEVRSRAETRGGIIPTVHVGSKIVRKSAWKKSCQC